MSLRTGAGAILGVIVVFFGLIARLPGMKGSAISNGKSDPAVPRAPDSGSTPVLVELFTSEGCSSCPPADILLRRLGRTQPVRGINAIVLEEHVDYWDRLGWKDPFSSGAATERQGQYGESFASQVYTPQMVVDGRTEFVGSSEDEALRAIRSAGEASKPVVHLSWLEDGTLATHVEQLTNATRGDAPQVYLAVTEDLLHSDVKRGENAGRALEHDGVARQLTVVGRADTGSSGFSSTVPVQIPREWNRANLHAVVFVQELPSRRVLAASVISFAGS